MDKTKASTHKLHLVEDKCILKFKNVLSHAKLDISNVQLNKSYVLRKTMISHCCLL